MLAAVTSEAARRRVNQAGRAWRIEAAVCQSFGGRPRRLYDWDGRALAAHRPEPGGGRTRGGPRSERAHVDPSAGNARRRTGSSRGREGRRTPDHGSASPCRRASSSRTDSARSKTSAELARAAWGCSRDSRWATTGCSSNPPAGYPIPLLRSRLGIGTRGLVSSVAD